MQLDTLIEQLVAFEPSEFPVISLYLDGRPDQHGKDRYRVFVRKELAARARTYPERSRERRSFDEDVERINAYLDREGRPDANGIAIFACAGCESFFQAAQLPVAIEEDELFVNSRPQIYPLVRVNDRFRRYAAVVLDTHTARIFVFGLGEVEAEGTIASTHLSRTAAGGWSQARYQRHVEKYQHEHVKEVVDALDRIVRAERIERIVLAGDDVVIPLVRAELPKHLTERLTDVLHLDIRAPEQQIFRHTMAAVGAQDSRDDAEKVRKVLDAYRAGGLGVAGVDATRAALTNGQVHELLLTARPATLAAPSNGDAEHLAGDLVRLAEETSARVTFIEDPALLAGVGGVAAFLRYRIAGRAA